jgi:hypothetical protein
LPTDFDSWTDGDNSVLLMPKRVTTQCWNTIDQDLEAAAQREKLNRADAAAKHGRCGGPTIFTPQLTVETNCR